MPGAEGNVCSYRPGKKVCRLHDHADAPTQLARRNRAAVPALEQHGAAGWLVETVKEPQERGLAGTAWTNQGDNLARRHLNADAMHQSLVADGTGQILCFEHPRMLRLRRNGILSAFSRGAADALRMPDHGYSEHGGLLDIELNSRVSLMRCLRYRKCIHIIRTCPI